MILSQCKSVDLIVLPGVIINFGQLRFQWVCIYDIIDRILIVFRVLTVVVIKHFNECLLVEVLSAHFQFKMS